MYLVLKNCRADGVALKAGDVVELRENTAKTLIDIGRVEVTTAKAEEPAEVVVEDRKEKPKRTRKAK
jgi:hypothetical protein